MSGVHVCVIGCGAAGRLHVRLLSRLGFQVSVVDSGAVVPPAGSPCFRRPQEVLRERPVDVWSVCSPTADHLDSAAAVLAHDPAARLLVEKPVCRGWETTALTSLLKRHEKARLVVMDQYAHAEAVPLLRAVMQELTPGQLPAALRVGFAKDRRDDIAAGRFVDHDHGIFGYEWLHMLALVRGVLPEAWYDRYLDGHSDTSSLLVAGDPELTSTAAYETAVLSGTEIELYSTIVGRDPTGQVPVPAWFDRPRTVRESRQRYVETVVGRFRFGLDLDPAVLPEGTALPRNIHRLTVDGPGVRREWLIHDSPLDNALRWSVAALLAPTDPPRPDLRSVARIGRLAAATRTGPQGSFSAAWPANPSVHL